MTEGNSDVFKKGVVYFCTLTYQKLPVFFGIFQSEISYLVTTYCGHDIAPIPLLGTIQILRNQLGWVGGVGQVIMIHM